MTSIEDYQRHLLAAQGYCELGMADDALAELEAVPEELQGHAKVVELRLIVLMQARRWKAALSAGRELTKIAPQKNIGYIHSAFCLHELGQTEAAHKLLLDGPETLHAEPVFHYNLACYECMLGRLDDARAHLTAVKGIGPWTADIYLMGSLGRADIWPVGDVGLQAAVQRALGLRKRPNEKQMEKLSKIWRPWRTVAARMLWIHEDGIRRDKKIAEAGKKAAKTKKRKSK